MLVVDYNELPIKKHIKPFLHSFSVLCILANNVMIAKLMYVVTIFSSLDCYWKSSSAFIFNNAILFHDSSARFDMNS